MIKSWKKRWFVLYSNGEFRRFDTEEDASPPRAAQRDPERTMLLRAAATRILLEYEAREFTRDRDFETPDPSDGKPRNSMFAVELRGEIQSSSGLGKLLWFCADDQDDALAWKLVLDDARTMQPAGGQAPSAPPMPPAYTAYPQQAGSPPGYYYAPAVNTPPGATVYYPPYAAAPGSVVVVRDDPYYYGYGPYGHYGHYGPYCHHHRCYGCHCHGSDLAVGMLAGAAVGSMLFMPFVLGPMFWC